MADCIFCKIIGGKIPSKIIYEDERCVVFHDINPKSRIHLLIVPKKHIETVSKVTEEDYPLLAHLIKVANKLAKDEGTKGYQLLFNVGKEAGQIVFHVHLHMMGR